MAVTISRLLPRYQFPSSSAAAAAAAAVCASKSISLRFNPCRKAAKVSKSRISSGNGKRKAVEVKTSVSEGVVLDPTTKKREVDWAWLIDLTLRIFRPAGIRWRSWQSEAQMFIETGIISCRFFTLIGVAGSLLGSVLCFVEGCFLVLESFLQYFHSLSERSDHGEVVQLLIEALGIFLVGTAMLIFGIGLYVQFVGSKEMKRHKGWLKPGSNLFGHFHLKSLPTWVEMQSVTQAKSQIGNAVVMILQAGVLEKFKSVPLVTGLDLACFAGAVLVCSASIFLLSRLSMNPSKGKKWL